MSKADRLRQSIHIDFFGSAITVLILRKRHRVAPNISAGLLVIHQPVQRVA